MLSPLIVLATISAASAQAAGRRLTRHASVTNPVMLLPEKGTEPTEQGYLFTIPLWPNFRSDQEGRSFIGDCGSTFDHYTLSACVGPALGDVCGRRLELSSAANATTVVTVVDKCSDLEGNGLHLTAAAYKELGGKLANASIEVLWDLGESATAHDKTSLPKRSDERSSMTYPLLDHRTEAEPEERLAISGVFLGLLLWKAGFLALVM